MKLIDKIKNAIFEEDEFEELENKEDEIEESTEKVKEEKNKKEEVEIKKEKEPVFEEDEVVKKIDIEKTIPKRRSFLDREESELDMPEKIVIPKREHRKTPVIFDEEDFVMDDETFIKEEKPKKEEVKKTLYGGYREEKPKEKFKPSPVLSPVYGFVGVSPVLEQPRKEDLSSYNELNEQDKKEEITVEEVRQKAFGIDDKKEDDDLGLLYDMKQDDTPAVSKVTIGDAEEYFDDLGLEYNVDYKDTAKEAELRKQIIDNSKEDVDNDLTQEIEEININDFNFGDDESLESTQELEITKEQIKPKTAKEIKKVKKIKDIDLDDEDENEEPEEKNLYDLIDMMYESKE